MALATPWSMGRRVFAALLIGAASFALSFLLLSISVADDWAGDFTWAWLGAKYLLSGMNPYEGEYPFEDPLFYPLPALFIAIPFTPFQPELAGALFFGLSCGVLGFVVTRYGYQYLPLFVSAPFFMATILAQWSPLLFAAALVPALLPLVIAKPSLGVAILATYPNRIAFAAIGLLIAVSLAIEPRWPIDWIDALRSTSHPSAALIFPGPLILLAALCWRMREARFLLLMALIPQRLLFYDQLLLWLVTKSVRQGLYLALVSWLGLLGWVATASVLDVVAAERWVVASVYLPATVVVLWRGRDAYMGSLISAFERVRGRIPGTRGSDV